MDDFRRYAVEQNVLHFMRLLEEERDGPSRSRLKGLLITEENRFAKASERLEIAERCLDKCSQRIREQCERLNDMDGDHPHREQATHLLSNMLDIQMIIQAQIDRLSFELECF